MLKPFKPDYLPITLSQDDIIYLYKLALEARVKIERFNSLLERSIISDEALVFFSLQESIESTKIEGTQTTFSEIMEADITGYRSNDIQEVMNYLEALNHGKERLNLIPISTRLFLELHNIILKDSRGQNRSPGEYRRIQNFIGPTNDPKDATYIPPEPNSVPEYMSNLEKYINNEYDDQLDYMIRAAIIHAQFETIHPFLDGNGRLGRILIMLYLLDKKVISKPAFFVSEELEKSKYKYYGLLNSLRSSSPKWKDWIEYFLKASIKQADKNIDKLIKIETILSEMQDFAEKNNVRQDLISFIFRKPFFTINEVQTQLNISYNTANLHVQRLVKSNKIFADDKKRNRIFRFYDILEVLEG
ncbi:Fic family protein [Alkaliphilus hydrothermalis]|uniref:Fic family protein n=1 Tax=Alkaliphilus hydrothermalis TaxID=1482730 RepID=A0ABS2NMN9_9FIRM|nr:Fic family protein [Alkaliphilus hydrothermalis]MBM7614204.1 Fic family protein [Alkaliphilus hydrothermalis]